MDFDCANNSDWGIRNSSLYFLAHLEPGCWTQLVFGPIAITNNLLLMTVAWKLGWFRSRYYALIVNQAIVDTLMAFLITGGAIVSLGYALSDIPDIVQQPECLGLWATISAAIACSQKSAFMVAIDRLINVLFPHKWAALGSRYRVSLTIAAWTWAWTTEFIWLAFVDGNECTKLCYGYLSYPDVPWSTFILVSDTITSATIVVTYLCLPQLSGSMFNRISCPSLYVALSNMEELQKETVTRVRKLSVLSIISYLCTVFVAFVFFDIVPLIDNDSIDFEATVYMAPFANVLNTLNAMLPLYLYAWKEETFRQQLFAFLPSKSNSGWFC